jgi:uncharacterized protein (TIGR02996 family)
MPRPPRPELLALLEDVRLSPDDLTPWLVLCDWLEENGDEDDRARSEYCRLCFDKLGKETFASDWELGERRRDLFRKHKHAWFGPILELNPTMRKGLAVIECSFHEVENRVGRLLEVEEAWAWVGTLRFWQDPRGRGYEAFLGALWSRRYYAALEALARV